MKKLVLTMFIVFGLSFGARAQVFILEDDYYEQRLNGYDEFCIDLPDGFGEGYDYYAPIGSGVLLLSGLAGVYLAGRKRKRKG